jgi:hypothetical protein
VIPCSLHRHNLNAARLPDQFETRKQTQRHTAKRGVFVIKKIRVAGFWLPFIGNHIKDWKGDLRDRISLESQTLAKLAKHLGTPKQSVSPVDVRLPSPVDDDSHNELECWEWLTADEEKPRKETDDFVSINNQGELLKF